ncbi:YebG family protein [Vibrio sp. S4M6]|uniref:YebG family protein n=1 Tax=Vibrio sinus TaxID=2946865 RepID=UPI002029E982|nr:YebG family protein [Vibrio sinus]MCL9782228.1 YebG family protein [Vibrio sinus]
MAVIVKYVVERNGEEKMTFTSKAEADAYDKMLDMADALFDLMGKSELLEDEGKQEELALYLAQNKEEVLYALGAKRRPAPKKPKVVDDVEDHQDEADASENEEDAA